MTEQDIEKKLLFVESLFEKIGAKPLDINEKNREKYSQRSIFRYGDRFYRVDVARFDEDSSPYMVLSCTDEDKYAQVGLMDDIEALTFDMADEELEIQVRRVFGIEPYPESG